jgi:hypothetical protein
VFPLTLIEGIAFNVEYGTWVWRARRLMRCDAAGSLMSGWGITGVPTGAGVSEVVSGQDARDGAFGWELGLRQLFFECCAQCLGAAGQASIVQEEALQNDDFLDFLFRSGWIIAGARGGLTR